MDTLQKIRKNPKINDSQRIVQWRKHANRIFSDELWLGSNSEDELINRLSKNGLCSKDVKGCLNRYKETAPINWIVAIGIEDTLSKWERKHIEVFSTPITAQELKDAKTRVAKDEEEFVKSFENLKKMFSELRPNTKISY